MSKWIPAALLVCIAVGVGFYLNRNAPALHSSPKVADAPTEPIQTNLRHALAESFARATNHLESTVSPTTALAVADSKFSQSKQAHAVPGAPEGSEPGDTNFSPSLVLENLRSAIRNYGQRMGGNPVGNNAEITKALNGENPKEVQYLSPEKGMRINANGELIDPWGTPYFFHQLSVTQMEIRSAGPDKKMWTADDLVTE